MVWEFDKLPTIIGILLALLFVLVAHFSLMFSAQEENPTIGSLDTGDKVSPVEECKAER